MVQTRKTIPAEEPREAGNLNQIILERLEQQQKMIKEMQIRHAMSGREMPP